MSSDIDYDTNIVSEIVTSAYVRRSLTSMLEHLPPGASELSVTKTAIEQLAARLAYGQSLDAAARYLGGTTRLLKGGGLQM